MNITWESDDGYAGGSAPQHLEIDDDEIAECDTLEEAEKLIWDDIQRDFEQKVRPICNVPEYHDEIQALIDARKKAEA